MDNLVVAIGFGIYVILNSWEIYLLKNKIKHMSNKWYTHSTKITDIVREINEITGKNSQCIVNILQYIEAKEKENKQEDPTYPDYEDYDDGNHHEKEFDDYDYDWD